MEAGGQLLVALDWAKTGIARFLEVLSATHTTHCHLLPQDEQMYNHSANQSNTQPHSKVTLAGLGPLHDGALLSALSPEQSFTKLSAN